MPAVRLLDNWQGGNSRKGMGAFEDVGEEGHI